MKKLNSTLYFRAFFLAALMIVSSCTQYIKLLPYQNINDYQGLTPESWSFRDYHNFIIIHFGDQIFELSNINYNQTNSTITGVINPTISTPLAYYNSVKNNPQNIHMMSKGDPQTLAEQIHLFVNKGQVKEDGRFEFSINDISQIDETVHQSKSNIGPGGAVALVAVSALTVGIIAVAVACGCPHVYINDGEELNWEQTLFTGATSPQLARSDLKAIKDYFPTQETLTLTLKNDEEEQQFIDKLSLKVVDIRGMGRK